MARVDGAKRPGKRSAHQHDCANELNAVAGSESRCARMKCRGSDQDDETDESDNESDCDAELGRFPFGLSPVEKHHPERKNRDEQRGES